MSKTNKHRIFKKVGYYQYKVFCPKKNDSNESKEKPRYCPLCGEWLWFVNSIENK